MTKKLLKIIVTLLCVMACTFGLAACNDGEQTVAVESVTLNKTELTLEIDGEETLTATVVPDNATNKTVIWTVSPSGIVNVDNGKVTAVSAGTATITATADGKSASCSVTVNAPAPITVDSVTLNKTELTLEIDGEETLAATVLPDNAMDKTVIWTVSPSGIVNVDNGKVTAVASGTAIVTATADGKSASCSVTVNAPAPATITGSYYMVTTSSTGWKPDTSNAFIFNADGTCDANGAGTYIIEDGVITINANNGSMTVYGVIEGKILWLFINKADTSDISNTVQMLYSDTEITAEDRAKFVELFGEGVTGSKN